IPQDGRYNFKSEGYEIDIRTSTLPTIYGEKVVLRLLGNNHGSNLKSLEALGMDEYSFKVLKRIMKAPNGIILVTGPTGSGKSTTLYAALNLLSQKSVNIVTIEDPVEQRMERINQVQVNVKAGLTFASALRSILRQDPDIIMVGEMRDEETASLAMRGAITGHLVLSTLHTNDSISAIPRMIDMGVPSYMVSAALTGVVAQRLVKTLCPKCKREREVRESDALLRGTDVKTVFEPVGCKYCNNTGFDGRKPIYEIVDVDGGLREMITKGASTSDMKKYENSKGTKFLGEKILDLVREGVTSVDEMERIVYSLEF
ncbi:MAG: GspE/PulE family protein, partial [Oscillospiraceae bacterium]